jgi:DnaJ-class molecular chaperone
MKNIAGQPMFSYKCPSCQGTGKSIDNSNPLCPQCDGKGFITLTIKEGVNAEQTDYLYPNKK